MEITTYMGLIVYVVSTLFTYIGGIISKRKGYNENLPIPIQNIIIGLICFVAILVFGIITKQEINIGMVVTYLTTALGGAGTATLAYDTDKSTKKEN